MTTGIRVLLSGSVTLLIIIFIAVIKGILYRRNNPDQFINQTEEIPAHAAATTTVQAVTEEAPVTGLSGTKETR